MLTPDSFEPWLSGLYSVPEPGIFWAVTSIPVSRKIGSSKYNEPDRVEALED